MILGIMQPYLFPYLGYYQLVFHCDKFVFYDDVNFIKRGYINRNSILVNSRANRFTLPVIGASRYKKINEIVCISDVRKILKTITYSYSKAPMFDTVYPLVEEVFCCVDRRIATIAAKSIIDVFRYLGIEKYFAMSSDQTYARELSAQDRIVSLCISQGALKYCNPVGGMELYDRRYFADRSISLQFLRMCPVTYNQGKSEFVSNLSMLDVLMWNDTDSIRSFLRAYTLE